MNQIVAKLRKNSLEELRVTLQEWKTRRFCDIRVWIPGKDGQDKPTYKGVTVASELLPDLRTAIDQAMDTLASKEGLRGKTGTRQADQNAKGTRVNANLGQNLRNNEPEYG